MLHECSACGSRQLKLLIDFPCSVTSDCVPIEKPVANVLCIGCGLVLNASGVRGHEHEFYARAYDLLPDTAEAEFTYETQAGRRGINAEMIDFLIAERVVPAAGSLLEIGCGKGVFLRNFVRRFPAWRVAGIEPSRNARQHLSHILPGIELHEDVLETSPFLHRQFDLLVAIGVLEHVPDPVVFAKRIRDCLAGNGTAFISVPNFDTNPSDLITFDHLNRFTPSSLEVVLQRAGLAVQKIDARERVPMWVLARRTSSAPSLNGVDLDALSRRAEAAKEWVCAALSVYDRLVDGVGREGRIGIYGTGTIGMIATAIGKLSAERIVCFFDDNPHLQGSTRLGRPVVALGRAKEFGITDLGFSANPCYLRRMEIRAKEVLGDTVKFWTLPPL